METYLGAVVVVLIGSLPLLLQWLLLRASRKLEKPVFSRDPKLLLRRLAFAAASLALMGGTAFLFLGRDLRVQFLIALPLVAVLLGFGTAFALLALAFLQLLGLLLGRPAPRTSAKPLPGHGRG